MAARIARNARDRLVEMNEGEGAGSAYDGSCDSCGRAFKNKSARNRHVDRNGDCTIDQEAAEVARLRKLQRLDEMVEETTFEAQKMTMSSPSPIPEQIGEPLPAATPGEGAEPARPDIGQEPRLEESDDGRGRFVERFPGNAGEPISPDIAHRPGLESYIKSCGRMSQPKWFSVAELLTTTKMTDKARTRHLKHEIVSIKTIESKTHLQLVLVRRADTVEELQGDECGPRSTAAWSSVERA
jgi:hypothetical protein